MTSRDFATEKELQAAVVSEADRLGWLVYHTYDSRRSKKGFPDLCMVKPPRVVFVELKTDSKSSQLSASQKEWITALKKSDTVVADLWRPADYDAAIEFLSGEPEIGRRVREPDEAVIQRAVDEVLERVAMRIEENGYKLHDDLAWASAIGENLGRVFGSINDLDADPVLYSAVVEATATGLAWTVQMTDEHRDGR